MARWIAFDQTTAAELRSRMPQPAVFEAPGRTALEYALSTPRTVVAVLDAPGSDQATIAVFRAGGRYAAPKPKASEPSAESPDAALSVRASGFLGLSDRLVASGEEESAEKKRWWQLWR
jgi:hypothetical protein